MSPRTRWALRSFHSVVRPATDPSSSSTPTGSASYPELQFYRDLGLAVTDGPEDAVVSWELVDGLDADVFMIDDRTTPEELAEADQIPTWGSIPAVAAGQAEIGWRFLLSYSRAEYARSINRLLPVLRAADSDVSGDR